MQLNKYTMNNDYGNVNDQWSLPWIFDIGKISLIFDRKFGVIRKYIL